MRVVAWVAIVAAVATGCGEADKPVASTPAPSATPSSGPLDKAQYQAKLTALEQLLAGKVRAIAAARTADDADSALSALTGELNTQISALASLEKVAAVKGADQALVQGLLAARDGMQYARLESVREQHAGEVGSCGGAAYVAGTASVLFSAHLPKAISQLRTAGVTFGSTLVTNGGKAPLSTIKNGTILRRSGPPGGGSVEIENSSTYEDLMVSVVPVGGSPKKPQVVAFLHGDAKATISGLRGNYVLYYQSGHTWSPRLDRFLEGCQFQRLNEVFTKDADWSVRLLTASGLVADVVKVPAY
jgi:hypothetical protein